MAKCIIELEGQSEMKTDKHHEQFPQFQKNYMADVQAMADAFGDLRNPYTDESADLMDHDQNIIMPQEVGDNVRSIKGLGVGKYQNFITNRILSQNQAFTAHILQKTLNY